MRWRVLLIVSLVANVVLAAALLLSVRQQATLYRRVLQDATPALTKIKTNVVVRRQFFSWGEVESDDYPTYIANLRDIGCPEQTIHDIIIADVNALYARKRATEVVTSEQQWWRTEPDTNVVQLAAAKFRELEAERRDLLTNLLGSGWDAADQTSLPRPTRPGLNLDGPVLGIMTSELKSTVQEIALRSQDRIQAYIQAQQAAGKSPDPAEIARLQKQTRDELAQVLLPQEMEEFLLRYSQNAIALRSELGQLKYFYATPDEFRNVFRATDAIDQQLQMLAGATDARSAQERDALEDQREQALKTALGAQRYAQYQLLHDPLFRDAVAAAQQAGTPDAALALYEISHAAAEEQARIRANTNLTAEQLAVELKRAELEQLKANAQALGLEVPPDPQPPPKPTPKKVHVLAPGENLNFLARLYGVNPDALRAANPTLNLDKLKAGDSVSVPINLLPPVPALPPQ